MCQAFDKINFGRTLSMKKIVAVVLLFVMMLALPAGAVSFDKNQTNKESPSALSKTLTSAAVADVTTDTLLYTNNSFEKIPAYAGVSRLMTAFTIEYQNRQNSVIKAGFSEEKFEDYMAAMLVKGDEEAARALAVEVAGSTDDFVDLMNATAEQIGMANTVFTTPHGAKDSKAVTTVDDLILLAYEAYGISEIKSMMSSNIYYSIDKESSYSRDYSILNPDHKSYNKMVNFYACGDYGDTGYVSIVGAMNSNGREIVAVTFESGSYVTDYRNNYTTDISSIFIMAFGKYYIAELDDIAKAVVHDLDGFALEDGTRVYASIEIPNDQKSRKMLPISYGEIIYDNYTLCSVDVGPLPEKAELNTILTAAALKYGNDELLRFNLRVNRIVLEDGSEIRSEYSLYSVEEGKELAQKQYKKHEWIYATVLVLVIAAFAVIGAEILKRRLM